MSHEAPLIRLKQITKKYPLPKGECEVLRGIDLDIKEGDSCAVMGPSGSGKSTLLQLIGCLDTPTSGYYALKGANLSQLTDKQRSQFRSEQCGFVFQFHHLISNFTVFENVTLPFLYHSQFFSEKEIHDRARKVLEKVGLFSKRDQYPSELSGGEAQRVAIARALVMNPVLLLADEPTGSLDKENKRIILELFKTLNKEGMTLIMVTHDSQVASCCQRMAIIEDGILYAEPNH